MANKTKGKAVGIKSKKGFVFKCVWLIIAVLCFIGGLDFFLDDKSFGGWITWGFLCCIPICGTMIQLIFNSTKKGARDGANQYTATVSSNSVTVSNHPVRGMIFGLIGGIIMSLLMGPVLLPVNLIVTVLEIILYTITMVQESKKKKTSENSVDVNSTK